MIQATEQKKRRRNKLLSTKKNRKNIEQKWAENELTKAFNASLTTPTKPCQDTSALKLVQVQVLRNAGRRTGARDPTAGMTVAELMSRRSVSFDSLARGRKCAGSGWQTTPRAPRSSPSPVSLQYWTMRSAKRVATKVPTTRGR